MPICPLIDIKPNFGVLLKKQVLVATVANVNLLMAMLNYVLLLVTQNIRLRSVRLFIVSELVLMELDVVLFILLHLIILIGSLLMLIILYLTYMIKMHPNLIVPQILFLWYQLISLLWLVYHPLLLTDIINNYINNKPTQDIHFKSIIMNLFFL